MCPVIDMSRMPWFMVSANMARGWKAHPVPNLMIDVCHLRKSHY